MRAHTFALCASERASGRAHKAQGTRHKAKALARFSLSLFGLSDNKDDDDERVYKTLESYCARSLARSLARLSRALAAKLSTAIGHSHGSN